jgi:branched-chain amino acid transport system ATP-binding protein
MSNLLDAQEITVTYGGASANSGVSLGVPEGGFVGLIGANGAGKTTFIDAITGFTRVSAGAVYLAGEDITGAAPERRVAGGLVRTFQSLELFDDLTVRENLLAACEQTRWWTLGRDIIRRRLSEEVVETVGWALRAVGLESDGERLPVDLSHGHRKLVSVARALAAKPKLLLLDEPAAGLDATESRELGVVLRRLNEQGISILLVDHDMSLVLSVCDEIFVLDFGQIIAQGSPAEIRRNRAVLAAYLGDSQENVPAAVEPGASGVN